MRQRLRELLRCPACQGALTSVPFVQSPDNLDVVEGVLTCACGASYPIVNTIPRMLSNAYTMFPAFVARYGNRAEHGIAAAAAERHPAATQAPEVARTQARTQESFGYQWTTFAEMACDFHENFWNYLAPATPEFLRGRLGLDAGCGFGRHLYQAASYGAEMIGMDLSRAIESSHANTKHFPNVHLVQADIYAPPFAPDTFDFVYSVGVLHHLPDPERGVRSLVPLVKPAGSFFVWLYSKTRRFSNFVLESTRAVTTRLPHPLVKAISLAGAVVDSAFVMPYRAIAAVPGLGGFAARVTPPRIKLYAGYPFQVLHADWFDRLAAPVRFYYNGPEVAEILKAAGLNEVQVAPTGLYGWRGLGIKPDAAAGRAGRA